MYDASGSSSPGTIRPRGNRWQVDAYVDGRRIRRTANTKTEAKEKLKQLQQTAARQAAYVSLDDVFLRYLHSLRRRAKTSSMTQTDFHLRNLEKHFGASFPVSELSPSRIDDFVEARLKTAVAKTSVNGDLRALRAALRLAVRDRDSPLMEMPCTVKLLTVTKKKPTVLTRTEMEAVIAQARPPYDLVAMIAGYSGLRHREVLNLQVRDIDLIRQNIYVTEKPGVWSPKDHEERSVPMAPRLADPFRQHIESLGDKSPTAWMFPGLDGTGPLKDAFRPIKEAFEAAGHYDRGRRSGLHMLRRTFASIAVGDEGADIVTVKELLGHEKVETTMLYLASNSDRKRDAVRNLR